MKRLAIIAVLAATPAAATDFNEVLDQMLGGDPVCTGVGGVVASMMDMAWAGAPAHAYTQPSDALIAPYDPYLAQYSKELVARMLTEAVPPDPDAPISVWMERTGMIGVVATIECNKRKLRRE